MEETREETPKLFCQNGKNNFKIKKQKLKNFRKEKAVKNYKRVRRT